MGRRYARYRTLGAIMANQCGLRALETAIRIIDLLPDGVMPDVRRAYADELHFRTQLAWAIAEAERMSKPARISHLLITEVN